VGYQPDEAKYAVVTNPPNGDVLIRRASDGKAVFRPKVGTATKDPDSGDDLIRIDFSGLKAKGTYVVDVPGAGKSDPFEIGPSVYSKPFRLAMRMFTGQRCGCAVSLAPDFPQFHHAACHTTEAQFDPSSGREGPIEMNGGWHDAGDFGRYVVNSGITTGTLLWAYEFNSRKLSRINLDLPDHKAGTPDVLTEIKWNLNWMLKMQDKDGGVWHKATTARFPGFIMPEKDNGTTVVVGLGSDPFKVTTATADFASVTAIAARVYKPFDRTFADRCLAASERAWTWAAAHPNALFRRNPRGISTGGYGDGDARDELLWASAELFRTTGKAEFGTYFTSHFGQWKPSISPNRAQNWGSVENMGMYAYALSSQKGADPAVVSQIRSDAVAAADELVKRTKSNGYFIPMRGGDYVWGSNSVVANYAMMLQIADRMTTKQEYRDAARDCLHYIFGRNTFATSYVTWLGARWPMHPHHRPSGADGLDQPWPGMLVGGPNANGKPLPAKQWEDLTANFTVNEVAINWNAPLVFAIAYSLK
jgi:endoglucanase